MLTPIIPGGQFDQRLKGVIAPLEGADSNASRSKTEQLYAQFSSILDKIALRLNENSGAPFEKVLNKFQHVEEKQPELREERPEDPPICEACPADHATKSTNKSDEEDSGQAEGKEESAEEVDSQETKVEGTQETEGSETEEVAEEGSEQTQASEETGESEELELSEEAEGETAAEELVAEVEGEILEELAPELVADVPTEGSEAPQLQAAPEQVTTQQTEVVTEEIPVEAQTENPELPKQAAQTVTQQLKPEVEGEQGQELPQQSAKQGLSAEERFLEDIQALNLKPTKSTEASPTEKTSDMLAKVVQMLLAEESTSTAEDKGPQHKITNDSMIASLMMRQAIDNFAFGKSSDTGSETGQIQGTQSSSRGHEQAGSKEQGSSASDVKSSAARTDRLTRGQTARTLERVQSVLKEMARSRDGKSIQLRLDPPTLGSVRVDMSFRDGALFARLAADNPAVNQLLRDKAHELQRVLRELGLNADQVNVAISSDSERREYEQDQNGFSKRNEGSSQSGAGVLGGAVQGLSQNGDAPADEDHWVA